MDEIVQITRLGRDGDGCADSVDGPVFIAGALPGETYAAQSDGTFERTGGPSPQRVEAPCRHFGTCGGCAAQHMAPDLYRSWKEGLIRSGFHTQGLDVALAPLFVVAPQSRRRAALTASVTGSRVKLGYHARRSHALVDLAVCPVLAEPITTALPALRDIVASIAAAMAPAKPGQALDLRVEVAALTGGLDVAVHREPAGVGRVPSMLTAAHLAVLARRAGLARLTVEGLVVCAEREPKLETSAGAITPPPGGFFQAAATAEHHMANLIVAGIGKARRVADLFCGAGTFSLPLAQRARVLAVDNDKPSLAALAEAARLAHGLKPIKTLRRDLFGEPLSPLELAEVDAVVFDPPRAGAKAQCEALARSGIKTVVAVSCNPATLARDCHTLLAAGFTMGPVQGIDQFLWSTHVEAVVVLTR